MEAERKSNRSNRHKSSSKDNRSLTIGLIALGLACMIPFIVLLKFEIDKRIALRNGMVNAGFYRDLVGEDYEYVVSHFEAAGFTNIELVDLDDSGILFWREDTSVYIEIHERDYLMTHRMFFTTELCDVEDCPVHANDDKLEGEFIN